MSSHLRLLREASGQSLRATARAARLDPAYLSRVERGQVVPSLSAMARLLRALGASQVAAVLDLYLLAGPIAPGEDTAATAAALREAAVGLLAAAETVGAR